ncbi:MAG: FlgD immunoglobulin-like domain containing protein [Candidatus Krumholzibacteria bacterium]|nr:FlgD immunoglobulin-like domain containing protein [Candidatus Krumholzibacteria bacterium]
MTKDDDIRLDVKDLISLIAVCFMLFNSSCLCAADWNMPRDFSGTQGESAFYYGYEFEGGQFTLMSEFGILTNAWTVDHLLPEPWYWTLLSKCSMHPDGSNEESRSRNNIDPVLRWLSPIADSILCDGHVWKRDITSDPISNGIDWSVKHNGGVIYSRYLEPQDSTGFDYSLSIRVQEGDVVDFVLNAHERNDHHDHTGYTVTIRAATVTDSDNNIPIDTGPALSIVASPNPFMSSTKLLLTSGVFRDGVSLRIFDVSGKVIDTIPIGQIVAGTRTVLWDSRMRDGHPLTSGVYFVQARGRDSVLCTRKIVLCR